MTLTNDTEAVEAFFAGEFDLSMPTVRFKKLRDDAQVPAYQTAGAAGFDFHTVDTFELRPGERVAVPTGLAVALPEGYELQCRPRSGLAAKHGITVVNAPGTIDSDYRGEIMVILLNTGSDAVPFKAGDRIAQGVVAWAPQFPIEEVDELPETARGTGGFGSTGR